MTPNFSSRFYRVFSISVDLNGVDPLRDKLVPKLRLITRYAFHTITQDERGAPDLISLREYGTDELWWVILSYNKIGHYKELLEGKQLKIPDYSAVLSLITQNTVRPDSIQRVVTI